MKKRNLIYEVLIKNSEEIENINILKGDYSKKVIINMSNTAKENGVEFVHITKNMEKIHGLLFLKYENILINNPSVYHRDYEETVAMIDHLKDTHPELISNALKNGNYLNIINNVIAINQLGDKVLCYIDSFETTLQQVIDVYCPSIYINGSSSNIRSTVDFLESVNLLHILARCPSILTNKTETIKDIYKFLKDKKRLGIIEENPSVLTAINCERVETMYDYGTKNSCLDKCTTMLTYKEENVLTNDKIFDDYGFTSKRIAVSISKNNPNKVADILDNFIEKDAYEGAKKRRTIINMKYEKIEDRTATLKANNRPIVGLTTGKINKMVIASDKDWEKYKLEGMKDGFSKQLTIKPIDIDASNDIKKEYVSPTILDEYIYNTDLRDMKLTDEMLEMTNNYMYFLDTFYSVTKKDGTIDNLKYSVNGVIISRNKVKYNLSKLVYNGFDLKENGMEAVIASMFGKSRFNAQQIENIVNSVSGIKLEKEDIKRPKQK